MNEDAVLRWMLVAMFVGCVLFAVVWMLGQMAPHWDH
jgi:hypothetical protein